MFKFKSFRKQVDVVLTQNETAALTAVGHFVVGSAKMNTPIDTGNLRDSLDFRVGGAKKSVAIGTNVEYAQFIEKGTSKSTAQPFITPAVEENVESIQAIIKGAWKM